MTLATLTLAGSPSFGSVEVRRITIAANVHPGAHSHNGPVFGVIETGAVIFQVGSGEESILRAGDTFYGPGGQTISRFDATEQGVTFLAWFTLATGVEPELTMGPVPSDEARG
ncbi:hypothetical protein ACFZA2_03685 [Microbacterium sp. NPDC007973]|uniref:hypothetical protein n=1 Tax=Microbacterium sp. NPDC007973 TaxID=3364182 RepID=UPI0036EE7B22